MQGLITAKSCYGLRVKSTLRYIVFNSWGIKLEHNNYCSGWILLRGCNFLPW